MKLTSTLSLALLFSLSLGAQQRINTAILQDARTAAVEHLGTRSAQLRTMRVVDNIGEIAIVSSDEVGTAFVSRTDGYSRVLGITPTAYTTSDALPCGLKLWLEAANHKILSNEPINAVATTMASDVEPFITTAWSQERPYNNLCPKSGDERCLTGCVATAMAQMMNYFEYPVRGKGTSTYYVTTDNETKSYTALIASVYDWANMIDNAATGSDTEKKAVAVLMRDCGYSVNMYYSTSGSGTSDFYVPSALSTHFSYDSLSVNYMQREYASDEEWYGAIYTELAAQRPVMLSGVSASQGGHAFVLDGMSTDGMVHINWGWGGEMNGYYDPAVMTSSADFTLSQSIVYGLNPQKTPSNPTEYPATHIVIDEPNLTTDAGQLYLAATVMNMDWRDFVGDIIYCVTDVKDTANSYGLYFLAAPDEGEEANTLPAGSGWYFSEKSPLNFCEYFKEEGDDAPDFVFPAGQYDVYMLYQGIHDAETKCATTNGGEVWVKGITVATDGTIAFSETTAIKQVEVDKTTSASSNGLTYDLCGRPVKGSAKGIVIVNGKKMLHK